MTILELPDKLPGWADVRVSGGDYTASIWAEDCVIEQSSKGNAWRAIIRTNEGIQAFVYADAIRRK